MAHVDTAPPEAVPDQYKESVGKLHNQVLTIFQHRKIPYVIMAQMADDGYVGLEDLADRWTTVERARTDVAADLLFRPQDRGGNFCPGSVRLHLDEILSVCPPGSGHVAPRSRGWTTTRSWG